MYIVTMSEIAIIIQARCGSKRLPNKMILPFFEDKSILEIIINRLSKKYKTVLATTESTIDDALCEIANSLNVKVFRGSEDNVLERFINTAKAHGIDTIVRVCADNPFINIDLIDKLLGLYNGEDYCSFKYLDGKPTILGHLGLFCEITKLNTLIKVNTLTIENLYREHVTNYIYLNPKAFNIKLFDFPLQIPKYDGVRLTVDTKQDFEIIKGLYKKFGACQNVFELETMINYVSSNNVLLSAMDVEIKKNSK